MLSKDEGRDALLRCLASTAPPSPVVAAADCDRAAGCDCADVVPDAEPPLLTGGAISELGAANAARFLSIFRSSSRSVLDTLGAAAADGREVGVEVSLLHRLCGQCEAVGAKRMALHVRAASERLKREESFDHAAAHRALEALYAETLAVIDAR